MFISCVCCVGCGLYDELITRPEESYRVCVCVCVCVRARARCSNFEIRRPQCGVGCRASEKQNNLFSQSELA